MAVDGRSNIKICGESACGSDRTRSPLYVSAWNCLVCVVSLLLLLWEQLYLFKNIQELAYVQS